VRALWSVGPDAEPTGEVVGVEVSSRDNRDGTGRYIEAWARGLALRPKGTTGPEVTANTTNEATLMALEIVSCRRNPISAAVDWDDF
jgi:hypothetical protein